MVPARHPPVQGGRLIEDGDQEDREERGNGPSRPDPLSPEEEEGCRGGGDAAGDGQGEVLDSVPKAKCGEHSSDQASRAFDPVCAGQRSAALRMESGSFSEQEAREQAGWQEGDEQRRHLQGEGEVSSGDAAEEEAACPEEDDTEGEEEGEAQKKNRHPAGGWAPAADERAQGRQEHPDPQGDEINQLDSVKGDVELPQQNDLPEERDEACQEERNDVGDQWWVSLVQDAGVV